MKNIITLFLFFIFMSTNSQENIEGKLPYYEIPEHSETYTAGTVAARMVDGLGFRYYWATEGLRDEDLAYKPGETARTASETLDHILGLSNFILGSISKENLRKDEAALSFEEKRRLTLMNIKKASDILRYTEDISQFDSSRFPFWNIINGPIADALWHCGQIVLLRRASGNPFNSKVSVFAGKLRE